MPRAFISHSSKDDRYVDELKAFVRTIGRFDAVFVDGHDIEPDERFWMRIKDEIRGCDVFVVVLSHASVKSKWVDREVKFARKLGKTVIPIRIDDCPLPKTFRRRDVQDLRSTRGRQLKWRVIVPVAAGVVLLAAFGVWQLTARPTQVTEPTEELLQARRELRERENPIREMQPRTTLPTPEADSEKTLQPVLDNGNPDERAAALLEFNQFAEADSLIETNLQRVNAPGPQHLRWLSLKARSRSKAGKMEEAVEVYTSLVSQYPDDVSVRMEYVNALLRPYTGHTGTNRLPVNVPSPGEGRRFDVDIKTVNTAVVLLCELLNHKSPPEVLQQAEPYLLFRLGLSYQIGFRYQRVEPEVWKPHRDDGVAAFERAAKLFGSRQQPDNAAESLQNAAVLCLMAADSIATPPSKSDDPKTELATILKQALDLLDQADAQLDPTTFTLTHYKIYKRKAHALLRSADRQPDSIRQALAFINKAKKFPNCLKFDDAPLVNLETWAYQRLAEYENSFENLTLAVRSHKQHSRQYYNAKGERCERAEDASELPFPEGSTSVAISFVSMDGAEPPLKFDYYRNWLALGGSYEKYLALEPLTKVPRR